MTPNNPKNYDYYFGGSLPVESDTYVKRQADDRLFQKLLNANFSYVLNSRQMGKSSLMVRSKQRLEKNGVACAAIDLTDIGSQNITVIQWYRGVVKQIVNGLELEIDWKTWWNQRRDEEISPVQMFGDFIREALLPQVASRGCHAVIFVDEIDSIINLPFPTDDFFALVRACHNKRAEFPLYKCLTFCLLGVATPSDLIADKTRTPFNIGTDIELTGFTFAEAKDALTPGLAVKVERPEAVLKEVLDWTGGQPFLTQKLCNLIVNNAESFNPDIPQLVRSYVIHNWEGQDNPEHLRTIRDRILKNEQNTSRLLGLYRRVLNSEVSADASPEQMELRLSGLVVKKSGCLTVYNRIYREIFNRDWIEAELAKLRSYSEAINGWLKSQRQDASRLLRGDALQEALEWGREKNLSPEDYAFLSASQESDRQEKEQALEIEKAELIKQEAQLAIAEAREGIRLERAGNEALKQFKFEQLSALVMAMKAGQRLYKILRRSSSCWQEDYPATSPLFCLQQILSKIKERNAYPHDGSLRSVNFSPDGKMLVTASDDGTVRLWDLSGNQIAEFAGHTHWVNSVSFSPDGQMLATASNDRTARLWDLSGKLMAEFAGHTHWVNSVSFSPDGQMLATASRDCTARLWNLSGKLMAKFVGHSFLVNSVGLSPDGKMLATASNDGTARLWDLSGNQIAEFAGHTHWVNSVSFSPDGQMLATASSDSSARLWNLSGNLMAEFAGHTAWVTSVSFSPDGKMLATASSDSTARLWALSGKQIAKFVGHTNSVFSVSFSPDGKMLATASRDKTLRLWDLSGKRMAEFAGHTDPVNSVSFSPDGQMLVTASDDRTARLWALSGKLMAEFAGHTHWVNSVSFRPDCQMLATASNDGTARLWNLSGNLMAEFAGHTEPVWSVSFRPDGKMLATASNDGTARLWNLSGKQMAEFVGHTEPVWSVSFSPDGQMLATASNDGTARLWALSGNQIAEFAGHTEPVRSVSFRPDGQMLATASDDRIARLWDLSGNLMAEFVGHSSLVRSVSFSPDGKMLATASRDKSVRLWDLSGNLLAEFVGHTASITSVSFSPDGKMLATASWDNTARLWRVENLEELLARGCEWLQGYFVNHPEALAELEVCRRRM
ncbi:MAG: AAA-like domain-containing protein [Cyanobacteriota bacterium]|nr:AAA-like domain-containing protein [Cyanobacteriota bacterium]